MQKLTDSEILARLIYRAYIAPDPHAPLEAEALLPFQAALDLYARTWSMDEPCGDACSIAFPEPGVPESDREPEPEPAAIDWIEEQEANGQ